MRVTAVILLLAVAASGALAAATAQDNRWFGWSGKAVASGSRPTGVTGNNEDDSSQGGRDTHVKGASGVGQKRSGADQTGSRGNHTGTTGHKADSVEGHKGDDNDRGVKGSIGATGSKGRNSNVQKGGFHDYRSPRGNHTRATGHKADSVEGQKGDENDRGVKGGIGASGSKGRSSNYHNSRGNYIGQKGSKGYSREGQKGDDNDQRGVKGSTGFAGRKGVSHAATVGAPAGPWGAHAPRK